MKTVDLNHYVAFHEDGHEDHIIARFGCAEDADVFMSAQGPILRGKGSIPDRVLGSREDTFYYAGMD